jgi:hypothetical protein
MSVFDSLNHIDTKVHSNTHIAIYVKTYCTYGLCGSKNQNRTLLIGHLHLG